MIKIFVAEHGVGRHIARVTSESGQTIQTGEERPTREAAIGALVQCAPGLFGVFDIILPDEKLDTSE